MSAAQQKKAIKQFRDVTGATEAVAKQFLAKDNWNAERAVDAYLQSKTGGPAVAGGGKADPKKLSKVFDAYAGDGADVDAMFDEKLAKFFTDVGMNPEGGGTLMIAYRLGCKTLGQISRSEFCDGFQRYAAQDLKGVKAACDRIQAELEDRRAFRDYYRWVFEFLKDDPERKTIEPETAYGMWELVLPKIWPLLPRFLAFCRASNVRAVSKDLWYQLHEFARDVKPDMSNYADDGGLSPWPVTIDEFAEKIKEEQEERKN